MWTSGLRLKVIEGRFKGRYYSLDAPDLNIGRAHDQSVRAPGWLLLEDQTVSRVQAYLRWNNLSGAYTLVNRSETNPTKVNGLPVSEEIDLKVGDRIQMGACVMDLQQVDSRFGGHNPRNKPAALPLEKAGPPPPPPKTVAKPDALSLEIKQPVLPAKPLNSKTQARLLALVKMPEFTLEVLEGPDAGQRFPVDGLNVAIGGPLGTSEAVAKDKKWFDKDIALTDDTLPPRCLGLSWNAPRGGFDLWRPGGGEATVVIDRLQGNMTWKAHLPVTEAGLVMAYDVIRVGRSQLKILLKPQAPKIADGLPLESGEATRFKGTQGSIGVRRPTRKTGPRPEKR